MRPVPQPGAAHIPLSVLYFRGARQTHDARAVVAERAKPDDGESSHHAAERDHRGVLAALLEHARELRRRHEH